MADPMLVVNWEPRLGFSFPEWDIPKWDRSDSHQTRKVGREWEDWPI